MPEMYLDLSCHRGRAFAAYLYLPRRPGDKVAGSRQLEDGLLLDLSPSGTPIGTEITSLEHASMALTSRVPKEWGFPAMSQAELAPLKLA